MQVWASALTRWKTAHQPTRLRAKNPGGNGHDVIEALFNEIAQHCLGFAWQHTPFARLRDRIALDNIWVFWDGSQPVGCSFASIEKGLLAVSDLVLRPGIDATESIRDWHRSVFDLLA